MLTFAANLSMLFTETPFLERFAAARAAGFKHVEFLLPYEYDPDRLADLLKENALSQCLFNLPSGDWAAGERGIASLPDRVDEFRAGVPEAIRYAKIMGVPALNCLAGKINPDFGEKAHHKALVENMIFAADALAEHGLTLLVENVNRLDIKDFYLHRTDMALEAIAAAGRPNIKLQYDIYHAQRSEGEIANTLRAHIAFIGHIQIADNPGRHEPGTGEINFAFIFKELEALGYAGRIGLEYVPSPAGLGWIRDFGYSL